MSCLISLVGHSGNTSQVALQPEAVDPSSEAYNLHDYLSYKNEEWKEKLSWVSSACPLCSIPPKSVPSQALSSPSGLMIFTQIISSTGKLCHQESISKLSFVLPAPTSFTNVRRQTDDSDGQLLFAFLPWDQAVLYSVHILRLIRHFPSAYLPASS